MKGELSIRISRGGGRRGEARLFAAECFTDVGDAYHAQRANGTYGRRRKFSNPLFLTPAGVINAYPESSGDLFEHEALAVQAVKSLAAGGEWEIRETSLWTEMRSKRYLRWAAEVKGKPGYTEPRRSIEELATIYENGGTAALRKLYTAAHSFHVIARLKREFPGRFGEGSPAKKTEQ